jgi:hypothetical protein
MTVDGVLTNYGQKRKCQFQYATRSWSAAAFRGLSASVKSRMTIVFCPLHEVAADLFEAVEYACRFLGRYHLAVPEQKRPKFRPFCPI